MASATDRLRKLRYDTILDMQPHILKLRDAARELVALKLAMHKTAEAIWEGDHYTRDGVRLDLERHGTMLQQDEEGCLDWPIAPGLEDIYEASADFVETAARMSSHTEPPLLPSERSG